MNSILELVFLLLLRMSQLGAFPSGPPLSTCENMGPHHGDATAQSGASPYNISVSKSNYTTGDNLTVTISGSKTFKGFILQAQGRDSSVAWPVGEFTQIPDGTQTVFCSGGDPKNTVAHNNPKLTNWSSRQFTWKAPTKSAGDISFIATIVEKFDTYWTKVASPVITGPPAENVTRGAPTQSFQIDKTGCGTTKGCYSLPPKCTGSADCTYLFTYQVSGGNVIIEMSAKQRWVAVGFNEQKKMDKMDAIMCATMATNLAELRHYYSYGHGMARQDLAGNSDITLGKIVNEDGGIKCRLTRKLASNAAHFRDLTNKWYILFAHGTTSSSGSAGYHGPTSRTFTADEVDLKVAATLVDEQSQIKDTINKDGCGETKSCYSEPANCKSNSDCNYLVTIKPIKGGDGKVEDIEFEISAKGQWAAIGFNKEKKMSGTDALICADVNGQVSVDHYVADKGYGTPTKTTPRPSALVKTLGTSAGGVVSCRFKRKNQDSKMLDLTEPRYLVYATGPMSGDSIGKHDSTPKTSPEKIAVDEIGVLGGEKKDPAMIKAHGCLMVIAWVGFASVGIFMARYMKMAFGDKELLGTKMWFTFHRALMVLTVLVTIIAVIIIFVYAGHWAAGAHPITGIIVLVLAVIQPIMALFRPHPGEDNRYIFNWAHRGVGLSALIMAVVSLFLGIRMDAAGLDDSPLYAMIAYCVGMAFVIVFDIYLSLKKNDKASFSPGGGGKEGGHVQLEPSRDQYVSARRYMLGFLFLLVSGVILALVVLIAISGEEEGQGGDHH